MDEPQKAIYQKKNKPPLCPRGRDKVLLKKKEGVMGECLCWEFLQLYFGFPLNTELPLASHISWVFCLCKTTKCKWTSFNSKADEIKNDLRL